MIVGPQVLSFYPGYRNCLPFDWLRDCCDCEKARLRSHNNHGLEDEGNHPNEVIQKTAQYPHEETIADKQYPITGKINFQSSQLQNVGLRENKKLSHLGIIVTNA